MRARRHAERRRTVGAVTDTRASSDAAASTPAEVREKLQQIAKAYDRDAAPERVGEATQPRLDYPPYRSSVLRHPTKDPHHADPEGIELWAPVFGHQDVDPLEANLNSQHRGEPVGERMI